MYQVTATNEQGFIVYTSFIQADSEKEACERAECYIHGAYNSIRAIHESQLEE